MNQMHKNDFGTEIIVTITTNGIAQDISLARDSWFDFEAPSGAIITRAAPFVNTGVDGKISYTSQTDDFDEVGTWKLQAVVEFGSDPPMLATSKLKSDIVPFLVKDNIL